MKIMRNEGGLKARLTRIGIAAAAVSAVGAIGFAATGFAASASAAQATPSVTGQTFAASIINPAQNDTESPDLPIEELAASRAQMLASAGAAVEQAQVQAGLESRARAMGQHASAIKAEAKRLDDQGKKFYWPTAGGITSPWGPRLHPILKYVRLHGGVDIGGACNQPIWAAMDGTVTQVSSGSQSGHYVRISHGKVNGINLETSYLHMNSWDVSVGQHVKRGQVIGKVGSTGLSTACHLHFATYENGTNVDPAKYLDTKRGDRQ